MIFFIQKINNRGTTLLELAVVMGITMIVMLGATSFIILSFRNQQILNDQLFGQKEARKVVSEIVNTVRTAEQSSIGGYPIVEATTSSLTIYANVDKDTLRERVHYWISGTNLNRGILKPSGNPLAYTGQEQVLTIAHDLRNKTLGTAIFKYFTENYTGTETTSTVTTTITSIRMIKIMIEIERDLNKSPVPLRVEALTQVRNLKTN